MTTVKNYHIIRCHTQDILICYYGKIDVEACCYSVLDHADSILCIINTTTFAIYFTASSRFLSIAKQFARILRCKVVLFRIQLFTANFTNFVHQISKNTIIKGYLNLKISSPFPFFFKINSAKVTIFLIMVSQ